MWASVQRLRGHIRLCPRQKPTRLLEPRFRASFDGGSSRPLIIDQAAASNDYPPRTLRQPGQKRAESRNPQERDPVQGAETAGFRVGVPLRAAPVAQELCCQSRNVPTRSEKPPKKAFLFQRWWFWPAPHPRATSGQETPEQTPGMCPCSVLNFKILIYLCFHRLAVAAATTVCLHSFTCRMIRKPR